MEKTTLTVELDYAVRSRATDILKRMDIDETTAIDMYYRQIITLCGLPFLPKTELTVDERLEMAVWASNPEIIVPDRDSDGKIIAVQDKDPDFYDWVVNG